MNPIIRQDLMVKKLILSISQKCTTEGLNQLFPPYGRTREFSEQEMFENITTQLNNMAGSESVVNPPRKNKKTISFNKT